MGCGTCGFVAGPGEKGHNARSCVLKDFMCRRGLPESDVFYQAGQCLREDCVHTLKCSVCHLRGHQEMTQKLRPERWVITNGVIKRRRKSAVVTRADFACPLLKDQALQDFLNNARGASAAAAQAKKDPQAVSRLTANTYQAKLSMSDAAELMIQGGSTAANLHAANRDHFRSLTKHAGAGGVEAALQAAASAESSLHDRAVSADTSGDLQSATSHEPRAFRRPLTARKEIRHYQSIQVDRARRHAAALCKSRTKARHGPSRSSHGDAVAPHAVAALPAWPPGARASFQEPLPSFCLPSVASLAPAAIAKLVIEGVWQCPMGNVEPELSSDILTGAVFSELRGVMLVSSGSTPALVAELLCCKMGRMRQQSLLTVIAAWVRDFVKSKAAEASPSVIS